MLQGNAWTKIQQFLVLNLYVLLACQGFLGNAVAQAPIILSDNIHQYDVGPHVSYLADESGDLSVEQVLLPEWVDQFTPSQKKKTLNFGFTHAKYWVRFTIQNPTDTLQHLILFQRFGYIRYMHLYEIFPGGGIQTQRNGAYIPAHEKGLIHSEITFDIRLPPNTERTFLIEVNPLGGLVRLALTLRNTHGVFEYFQGSHTGWGLLMGGLIFLGLYNLLHFFLLRDRSYLYYVLFILSGMGSIAFVSGWGYIYVQPYTGWWNEDFNTPPKYFFLAFYIQYARSLLNFDKFFPRFDQALRFIAWGLGCLGVWTLFFHSFALSSFGNLWHPVTFVLVLIMSGLRSWQRYVPAYWLFFSSSGLVIGIGITAVAGQVIDTDSELMLVAFLASIGLEFVLFSMGLSSRHSILRREKEQAQNQAIQLQQQIVDELKRADQLKDEFLANVSHELRTPLHGIIGLGQAFQTEGVLTQPAHRENMQLIITSAQRLATLVNDILDFSRIRNHDLQLQKRQVEMLSLLRLVEGICQPMLGNKPVVILLEVPQQSVWLVADENRLQQILINLLSNAAKFTHEGEIYIKLTQSEANVTISVRDTGIGIPFDKQEQIFKPFFQADGSISRRYAGTGLGLAITKQLIELHNGELHLKSKPGKGSEFSVILPKAGKDSARVEESIVIDTTSNSPLGAKPTDKPDMTTEESKPVERASVSPQATILVVDDEPVNLKVVETQLAAEGYWVRTAIDGFRALEEVKLQRPDLILLDIMMPRLNGYEVCRQLRETYNPAQVPIIMLTARTQVADTVKGLQAGANDYLTKPFHKEELVARVRSQLQQKAATELLQENQRLQWEIDRAHRQERLYRQTQERLTLILDASQEAIIAVDEKQHIVFINQLASQWLNISVDDWLNQPVSRLIPPDVDQHPIALDTNSSLAQVSNSHYPHLTLEGDKGHQWEGQMWQTSLETDEPLRILTLAPINANTPSSMTTQTPRWVQELNVNRQRLLQLIDLLADLTPDLYQDQPKVIEGLKQLDATLSNLISAKPEPNPETRFRQTLVKVMQQALLCWEFATGTTMVELAQESGLWAVHTEENRLRARTAERYLEVKRLPQKPRWRNVVNTANYVLGHCPLPPDKHHQLNEILNQLTQLIHQRHLS